MEKATLVNIVGGGVLWKKGKHCNIVGGGLMEKS